jgi:polyhydroxyalkanoate synthesis repressor PhaR
MNAQRVIVKKYENRRLYDTSNSRYVNLDDIARMVREGIEVQVIDASTGEDLTRPVLMQIIVDGAKTPGAGFPLDMLRQMVVASGRASQEGFLKYMRAMFDLYQNTYRAVTPVMPSFDFMDFIRGGPAPAAAAKDEAPGEDTIRDLRQRLDELERKMAGPAAKKTAGRRRAARTRGSAPRGK